MAVTAALYAATATAITGTWTTVTNAQGSTNDTYATCAQASNTSCAIETSAHAAQAAVPAGATVNSVTYRVRYSLRSNSEVQPISSFVASMTAELRSGATVKASNNIRPAGTAWASGLELEFTVTGVTYAELADLRVRVTKTGSAAGITVTAGLDWARVSVDYTAAASTVSTAFLPFF